MKNMHLEEIYETIQNVIIWHSKEYTWNCKTCTKLYEIQEYMKVSEITWTMCNYKKYITKYEILWTYGIIGNRWN